MTPQPSPHPARPVPVVLDVDTGVDDAMALLLAARHPALDLRAVTCVAGNTGVEQVVDNTLRVLHAAGADDVPVAQGADRPLLEPARSARHVHGDDGMADLALPAPTSGRDPRHAVELLRDLLLAAAADRDPVTVVSLGPMTNLALLLRTHPGVVAGMARLVFMGGAAVVGNATAAAEFNIWHDPESAAVVLDALAGTDVPVTMYGLDVFYAPRVHRDRAALLSAMADPVARLAGRLVEHGCRRFGEDDATIGDAGAVAAVVDPTLLTTRSLPVRVELAGTWTRGQTVVDQRPWTGDHDHDPHGRAPALVDVALAVDAQRCRDLWLSALT